MAACQDAVLLEFVCRSSGRIKEFLADAPKLVAKERVEVLHEVLVVPAALANGEAAQLKALLRKALWG